MKYLELLVAALGVAGIAGAVGVYAWFMVRSPSGALAVPEDIKVGGNCDNGTRLILRDPTTCDALEGSRDPENPGLCTAGFCNSSALSRRFVTDPKLCGSGLVPEVSVGILSSAQCAAVGGVQESNSSECFLKACSCSADQAKALLMPPGRCSGDRAEVPVVVRYLEEPGCANLGGIPMAGQRCGFSLCVKK